jgi:hypothetical protein
MERTEGTESTEKSDRRGDTEKRRRNGAPTARPPFPGCSVAIRFLRRPPQAPANGCASHAESGQDRLSGQQVKDMKAGIAGAEFVNRLLDALACRGAVIVCHDHGA